VLQGCIGEQWVSGPTTGEEIRADIDRGDDDGAVSTDVRVDNDTGTSNGAG